MIYEKKQITTEMLLESAKEDFGIDVETELNSAKPMMVLISEYSAE